MKPQDLSDEELVAELIEPLPHGWAVREAARRLTEMALKRQGKNLNNRKQLT